MSGSRGADRQPVAATTKRAVTDSPVSVSTLQVDDASSKIAAVTIVENWMSRRRSRRSATKFKYSSTSACAGISSVQTHSRWISSEKLNEYSMLCTSQRAPGYRFQYQVPPTPLAVSYARAV